MLLAWTRVVEYASAEEAQRAMRELHDETFGGRMLFVREVGDLCVRVRPCCAIPAYPSRVCQQNYRASYKRDFQVLITNVPPRAAWWEIKDLVRPLGGYHPLPRELPLHPASSRACGVLSSLQPPCST